MARDSYGVRIVHWRRGWTRRRVCQWVSPFRVSQLHVAMTTRWYLIEWRPWIGWQLLSSGPTGAPVYEPDYVVPLGARIMKRRLPPAGGSNAIIPALPAASTMLAKLPALREFVTATSYEDGTPRVPGYFTLRNRGATFELTAYDYDSGCRLVVAGNELDRAFQLLEQLLGVEEAQWEPDRYLMDLLAKRTKGKRK